MIVVVLILLGLALGSFTNALVWRQHEQAATKSKKRLRDLSIVKGRSMCPHCRHALAAKDLIPVFSWLSLKGRCRYCQKPISGQYPLIELLTAALFVLSYLVWPHDLSGEGLFRFAMWLPALVTLVALTIYDLKWMILPDKLNYVLTALGAALVAGRFGLYHGGLNVLTGALWAILCLGGLFYVLFQLSDRWIGGGDVKLGFALGLFAGGPLEALAVLFVASTLGTVVALALLTAGKASRKTQVPFGPFLIGALVLVQLFGPPVLNWYRGLFIFV